MWRVTAILLGALLIWGCATYREPQLPREQVAIIVGKTTVEGVPLKRRSLLISEVDDLPFVVGTDGEVVLLPGCRSVRIEFQTHGFADNRVWRPIRLRFRAEANHRYQVDGGEVEALRWTVYLVDSTTGARDP